MKISQIVVPAVTVVNFALATETDDFNHTITYTNGLSSEEGQLLLTTAGACLLGGACAIGIVYCCSQIFALCFPETQRNQGQAQQNVLQRV